MPERYKGDDNFIDHPDDIVWEVISTYLFQKNKAGSLDEEKVIDAFDSSIFLVNEMYCSSPIFELATWEILLRQKK